MEKSKEFFKSWWLLFLIILVALGLRLLWLDRIPAGITSDELDYILDAKSIFYTGKDITGTWSPFSLTTPPRQFPKAELPALLIVPIIGFLNLSLFSARLPYVLINLLLLVVLFLMAKKFWGKKIALVVAAVFVVNPWSFYFGRTAFEAPIATTFYFLALYILLSTSGWRILLSLPIFFLAFYSYIGTKLIFTPFVLWSCFCIWHFVNKKHYLCQYLLLFFLSLGILGWFLFSTKGGVVNQRKGELLTPLHPLVVQTVNDERRLSINNSWGELFSNKLIVFSKLFWEKYLGSFSLDFLFVHGEGRATYSVWYHGLFYYLDVVFLIFGFYFLWRKSRSNFALLLGLLLIAPLPAAFSTSGEEYALRGALVFPIFILLIGLGIGETVLAIRNNRFRFFITILIVFFYLFQVLNYLNIYFFRNPIYNSESFGLSNRLLAKYLQLAQNGENRVTVVSNDPLGAFKNYLFYADLYERVNLSLVREKISKDGYYWDNIYFLKDCPLGLTSNSNETLVITKDVVCKGVELPTKKLSIVQLGDSGEIFKIYNDHVCRDYDLKRYVGKIDLEDLRVEELATTRFCQSFIVNFD